MAEGRKQSAIPSISRAHSAALVARLLTLEHDCWQMDRVLDGYAGIYYQHVAVFPDEARRKIRTLISAILEKIARIKRDLNLPQRRVDVDKLLTAYLSEMWVTLHETKAETLGGYGEVRDELRAYLDPQVEEVLGLVASLRDTIDAGKDPAKYRPEAGE